MMHKAILWLLLAAAVGLNVKQYYRNEVTQLDLLAAQGQIEAVITVLSNTPVLLRKDLNSGNVYVTVPYSPQPLEFKGVCRPERAL